MSNAVKWALLAAGLALLIALVVTLPFVQFMDLGQLGQSVSSLVSVAGGALSAGRGIVNNFLSPFGRNVLTGLLSYLLLKFVITITIKITAWVYHFIFRG